MADGCNVGANASCVLLLTSFYANPRYVATKCRWMESKSLENELGRQKRKLLQDDVATPACQQNSPPPVLRSTRATRTRPHSQQQQKPPTITNNQQQPTGNQRNDRPTPGRSFGRGQRGALEEQQQKQQQKVAGQGLAEANAFEVGLMLAGKR